MPKPARPKPLAPLPSFMTKDKPGGPKAPETKPVHTAPVTIELPLPDRAVAQNTHVHWSAKARATASHRTAAHFLAKRPAMGFAPMAKARISAVWYMGKKTPKDSLYRPLDEGNAIGALKGAIDGLVDAGLIEDDDHTRVSWGRVELKRTAKEHQGRMSVVITVEPC